MIILLRKSYIAAALSVVAAVAFAFTVFGRTDDSDIAPDYSTVVIDAGHGGMDGGAQGQTGVLEKNINLSIALKLKEIAEKDGKKVVMTRETDTSLHTTDSKKIRTQKRSDLQNRKQILSENSNRIFVSIHQNKFEQQKYRGAQVFYADSDNARRLGEAVQKSLISGLGDGNSRVAKQIPSDVFLLKGVSSTAIIVECGFLSNPEEEKLLSGDEYQTKLAQCIYDGIKQFEK